MSFGKYTSNKKSYKRELFSEDNIKLKHFVINLFLIIILYLFFTF